MRRRPALRWPSAFASAPPNAVAFAAGAQVDTVDAGAGAGVAAAAGAGAAVPQRYSGWARTSAPERTRRTTAAAAAAATVANSIARNRCASHSYWCTRRSRRSRSTHCRRWWPNGGRMCCGWAARTWADSSCPHSRPNVCGVNG